MESKRRERVSRMIAKQKHKLVRGAGASHCGKVRENNEDALLIEPDIGLYAVLDGMGGAEAGEVAAQLARTTIAEFVRARASDAEAKARELLELALDEAAVAVFTEAKNNTAYRGMGTTAVAFLATDSTRFVIGHVGDSRAYRLRAGCLQLLTRDHTLVQDLIEAGMLKAEDANRSPVRNVLTRNLGSTLGVWPAMHEDHLEPGDRLLLCSDGLYNELSAELICRVLGSYESPDQAAHRLVDIALEGEARDNISVVVIDG
jgi:serine/threonine protein phosphatase PrpC